MAQFMEHSTGGTEVNGVNDNLEDGSSRLTHRRPSNSAEDVSDDSNNSGTTEEAVKAKAVKWQKAKRSVLICLFCNKSTYHPQPSHSEKNHA